MNDDWLDTQRVLPILRLRLPRDCSQAFDGLADGRQASSERPGRESGAAGEEEGAGG